MKKELVVCYIKFKLAAFAILVFHNDKVVTFSHLIQITFDTLINSKQVFKGYSLYFTPILNTLPSIGAYNCLK